MASRIDKAFYHVGEGHKSHSKLPPIKEEPLPLPMMEMIWQGDLQEGTRLYTLGQCSILVSPPMGPDWGWHLSISHPARYPTWDELAKARYELLDNDIDFEMPLPRTEDYVNIHSNCFQIWESGKKRTRR